MEKIWISTNELAKIKGISARAVRKTISANKYKTRKNGRTYEILISTLDLETQYKIKREFDISEYIPATTEAEKKLALAKFELVQLWRKFRKEHNDYKTTATQDFLFIYNTKLNYNELYKIVGNVSKSTIHRLIYLNRQQDYWLKSHECLLSMKSII